ncbi:sugar phosphate isomerase/epimerase family protein [Nesterenkonia sp. DZ6]|uniref:sugar phosphate isomerase/epimerase family protein n=1 Tax=Nesterenkonia sp. DZ6 TaxID=2901229 RepID=UPI001F4D3251|nr:sugar phosphate isomerase/epimerase [Nesterenkonia sp. DZ6]MCH8560310.1 sugar phosphate isomerase/epimerase [Nesterenkonia sp. DZ6]
MTKPLRSAPESAQDGTAAPLFIGTAPDSWGVWFPDDAQQTPWNRFLDEAAEAGYHYIELGPYGYLPTDPDTLNAELAARDLAVSAGTVFTGFHRMDPAEREAVWKQVHEVAELTAAVGGEHIVVIPAMWRDDVSGEAVENEHLTEEQWQNLFDGHDELGRVLQEQYGLKQQFHSHADSHVCTQQQIERFLQGTDPELVTLCLDTGHAEYGGASSAKIIREHPERVGYLHLKQIDPKVMETVRQNDLTWAAANKAGVMVEPPGGLPDLAEVIDELEKLDRSLYCIVEQDMYPVASFDVPLPIATRTRRYLCGCGSRTRIR